MGPLARIIATSDGTLTQLLRAWYDESLSLQVISQQTYMLKQDDKILQAQAKTILFERHSRIVGSRTDKTLVLATSRFIPSRLPLEIVNALLSTTEPIGELLRRNRLETFREIIRSVIFPVDENRARVFNTNKI